MSHMRHIIIFLKREHQLEESNEGKEGYKLEDNQDEG